MLKRLVAMAFGVVVSTAATAENLMQVYEQALHSDPTFKQAESTWWTTKQNLPIAVAAYLPQVNLTYNWSRIFGNSKPSAITTDGWHSQQLADITATQPLFNFATWMGIRQASSQVKAATATYLSAIQDLMQRASTAYFAVLEAEDELVFTIANKRAVKRNLTTAEQQFKVGLIAITGVYDAQSRYNQAEANEIADRNNVYNAMENLRAITGQHYSSLMGIKLQVPLIVPVPNNINTWVSTAERQNYGLKAQEYTTEAAKQNIKIQAAAFLPTVSAENDYTYTKNYDYGKHSAVASGANLRSTADTWGLALNWNALNGGADYYTTKQARYQYLTAVGQLEFTHRGVVNQTRQAFFGIVSSISKIKADYLTIVSFKSALKATEAGYQVGTRTMVDVLNAIADVFRSENTYMDDQYSYMNDIVSLKFAAGTLSEKDLAQLNSWLKKKYHFKLPAKYYRDVKQMQALPSYSNVQRADKPTIDKAKLAPHLQSAHYSIQFYASNHLKAANWYRSHTQLANSLRIVRVGHRYKVVYGDYGSRAQALVALDALPINHSQYHAWVTQLPATATVFKPTLTASILPKPSRLEKSKAARKQHSAPRLPLHAAVSLPLPART